MGYIQHKLGESLEGYLETILILGRHLPIVPSIDVANKLDFSKASVSVAMKNLKNRDYITVSDNWYISLTKKKNLPKKVYKCHNLLKTGWCI